MQSTTEITSAPVRKHWQYSLRTLLVVMVVVGFGSGFLALRMQRARQQEQAIEEILNLEAEILYHYQIDNQGKFDARRVPSAPEWLRSTLGRHFFDRPASVSFYGGKITDADLLLLGNLPSLNKVYLVATAEVTQQGIDRLQQALPKAEIERYHW